MDSISNTVAQIKQNPDLFIQNQQKAFTAGFSKLTLAVKEGESSEISKLAGEVNNIAQELFKLMPELKTVLAPEKFQQISKIHDNIKINVLQFQRQLITPLLTKNALVEVKSEITNEIKENNNKLTTLSKEYDLNKNPDTAAKIENTQKQLNKAERINEKLDRSIKYLENRQKNYTTFSNDNVAFYRDLTTLGTLLKNTSLLSQFQHHSKASINETSCDKLIKDINHFQAQTTPTTKGRNRIDTNTPFYHVFEMLNIIKKAKSTKSINGFEIAQLAIYSHSFKPDNASIETWKDNEKNYSDLSQKIEAKQSEIDKKIAERKEPETLKTAAPEFMIDREKGGVRKPLPGAAPEKGTRPYYENQIKSINEEIKQLESERGALETQRHKTQAIRNRDDINAVAKFKKVESQIIDLNARQLIENTMKPPDEKQIAEIQTLEKSLNEIQVDTKTKRDNTEAAKQNLLKQIDPNDPEKESKIAVIETKMNTALKAINDIYNTKSKPITDSLNSIPFGSLGSNYCLELKEAYDRLESKK